MRPGRPDGSVPYTWICQHGGVSTSFFVDIWSDVVCPFCYLGHHQFRAALERFEHREHVVVRHHAFELDPRAPLADGTPLDEMLAAKYSMPVEQAAAWNQRVADDARRWGMEWSLDKAQPTNTLDAHRVIALAAQQGRQGEMLERLFRAYFSEGLLVSDHDVLDRLAQETGVAGAAQMLKTDTGVDAVRHDEHLATRIGITGVPALILDGRVHVSGAQGTTAMYEALCAAWAQRQATPS